MSESQERMMAIVEPHRLEEFLAITTKWDVEATVLGEVTDTGRLVVTWHGEVIVDVPPRSVAHEGPTYHRPLARPTYLDVLTADDTTDPVSYTHLDVYKRQGSPRLPPAGTATGPTRPRRCPPRSSSGPGRSMSRRTSVSPAGRSERPRPPRGEPERAEPVSYTHLDVYKRQGESRPWRITDIGPIPTPKVLYITPLRGAIFWLSEARPTPSCE